MIASSAGQRESALGACDGGQLASESILSAAAVSDSSLAPATQTLPSKPFCGLPRRKLFRLAKAGGGNKALFCGSRQEKEMHR